jgi:hypothetical protein
MDDFIGVFPARPPTYHAALFDEFTLPANFAGG